MHKIQIVSSKKCKLCQEYFARLAKLGFTDYVIYDADNPNNDKQLDEWKIINMPVIQIVEEGMVKFTFPYAKRGYTPRLLKHKLKEIAEKNK